jgi:hypothetical protein
MASPVAVPMPGWQSLQYEQQYLWLAARSEIELNPCEPGASGSWCLRAVNSVANNREEITLRFLPESGRLQTRQRHSRGTGRRYKQWNFLPAHVLRERRVPDRSEQLPPGKWPLSSSIEIAYPEAPGVVSDPLLLLVLAAPGRADFNRPMTVMTDQNFYRVVLSDGGSAVIPARYEAEGRATTHAEHAVQLVHMSAQAIQPLADKPDFSLLGLSGRITIAFDRDNGLPLQLRGAAPRLGSVELNLKAATLRKPAQ